MRGGTSLGAVLALTLLAACSARPEVEPASPVGPPPALPPAQPTASAPAPAPEPTPAPALDPECTGADLDLDALFKQELRLEVAADGKRSLKRTCAAPKDRQ